MSNSRARCATWQHVLTSTLLLMTLLILMGLLMGLPSASAAEPDSPQLSGQDRVRRDIGRDIQHEIDEGRLVGVSVALVSDGKIAWEEGFGWADRESHRPATAKTPFSIASTTKPMTTTAMMVLASTGKLDLDHPANDYLGREKLIGFDSRVADVTVRQIASHTGGLPSMFVAYPENEDARQPTVAELVRDYGRVMAPPGERYEYSNVGMATLGDVVARQSNGSFSEALQTLVFDPLGMEQTFADVEHARHPEMATRYDGNGRPLPFYLTATPGSGAVYSSAHDLARFAMLHLGGDGLGPGAGILGQEELAILHRPVVSTGEDMSYALGWEVWHPAGRSPVLHHNGGQTGVATEFMLLPGTGVACVVLSNRADNLEFLAEVRDRMIRSVLPDWTGLPADPDPVVEPLEPLQDYVGTWIGTLRTPERHIPMTITISANGTGTLSLDHGTTQPIASFGLLDGLLSGDVDIAVDSRDAHRKALSTLSLGLKLRGGQIDGEVATWGKTPTSITILPYWVRLDRQPD